MYSNSGLSLRVAVVAMYVLLVAPSSGAAGAGRFDEHSIVEHIRILASDSLEGRRGGSRGARIASEYIKDYFDKLGLKPAGSAGGFFQEFSFVSGVALGDSNALQMECGGRTIGALQGTDYSPIGSSANGRVDGGVVFVGYGLKDEGRGYDDFADIDLRGSVAVALEGLPSELENSGEGYGTLLSRKKAMLARAAGAVGLVIVRGNESDEELDSITYDGVPGDVGISFARVSREFGEQILGCGGLTLMTSGSIPAPQALRDVSVELRTDIIQERATGRNVAGIIEGGDQDLRDQYVVVGAHFDHIGTGTGADGEKIIYNGADDNASGVAGLLELASYLSKDRPRRSVLLIAFDAEELGALGSLHFMKDPTIPKGKMSAMVNLDMIGRMRESKLVASGYDTSPAWDKLLEMSSEGLNLDIKKSSGGFGASDHTSFYKDDIPVLFFFTGAHDDYNTPNDDWDRINAEGEAVVLEYVSRVIMGIGNADEPPPFKRSSADRGGTRRSGLSVYMGTVPDYASEGEGFAIIGTKEGSPAEKAGLAGGDVIVKMDGVDVRNIYDFMGVLGGHKPGDVITVVVMRKGAEVTLEVTLEKK